MQVATCLSRLASRRRYDRRGCTDSQSSLVRRICYTSQMSPQNCAKMAQKPEMRGNIPHD